jgi:hypothetical protein
MREDLQARILHARRTSTRVIELLHELERVDPAFRVGVRGQVLAASAAREADAHLDALSDEVDRMVERAEQR